MKKKILAVLAGIIAATAIVQAQTGRMITTTGVVYVRSISGVTLTSATFSGQSKFADGSAASPSITFASDPDTGIHRVQANVAALDAAGATVAKWFAGGFALDAGNSFFVRSDLTTNGLFFGLSDDLFIGRDAANVLAQRNGTNAQTYRLYRTYTDAANNAYVRISWSGNGAFISSEGQGTGTPGNMGIRADCPTCDLELGSGGGVRWQIEDQIGYLMHNGVAFASLGTPAGNGRFAYCTDCTKATPCAGGGTGALAKRLNGAWDCN